VIFEGKGFARSVSDCLMGLSEMECRPVRVWNSKPELDLVRESTCWLVSVAMEG